MVSGLTVRRGGGKECPLSPPAAASRGCGQGAGEGALAVGKGELMLDGRREEICGRWPSSRLQEEGQACHGTFVPACFSLLSWFDDGEG